MKEGVCCMKQKLNCCSKSRISPSSLLDNKIAPKRKPLQDGLDAWVLPADPEGENPQENDSVATTPKTPASNQEEQN